jgi:peroxiredoxin
MNDSRLAVPVLLTLILALCAPAAWAVRAVDVDDQAPDFTLPLLDGGNLRLQEQRGQVVLVNFWASWCGPCRQEMPLLERMHQRYQDAGFVVLGVNVEGEERPARGLVQQTGVTFPILIDKGQQVSELYDVSAMPSSVVLDRNGVVRYVHLGYVPGDEAKYLDVIQRLIRE